MEGTLSQYRIFYEVAKAGNISRASKTLFISQPGISKAISRLEKDLDTTLFLRNSRGVKLTTEGEVLFEYISNAFLSISQGEEKLSQIRKYHMGKIHIGTSSTLCRYILLPHLRRFARIYPHTMIHISTQPGEETLHMLQNYQIDLALIAEPAAKNPHVFLPLQKIHDIFAAAPQYMENLSIRSGKDCNPFASGNIMLLNKENVSRKYIDVYLEGQGIFLNQLVEATNMDLLIELAKAGIGIACVTEEFIQEELASGILTKIPLDPPIPPRSIGFSHRENNTNPALQHLLRIIFASTV